MPASDSVQIIRFAAGKPPESCKDEVAGEEPLEIRVEGKSVAVIMRTPGHDRELAAGFLFSEEIIRTARDIFDITACVPAGKLSKGNVIDVALRHPGAFDLSKLSRHVFTSSSCGMCSQSSIKAVVRRRKPLVSKLKIDIEMVRQLPARLAASQEGFKRTGGLHACALFSADGALSALREDVGRHNALDKLIGSALLENRLPLTDYILLLSGRSSFEMIQKAYTARIAAIAAIGAPSSLAVALAQKTGQTLIGFLRADSMNVYTGAERISGAAF
ncbi:MAG: formate dehydrogenase family accessory protein FdhD [Chthoniobacteraceae bacterium]|nr:formate dehydrogenase family accessory protein FdhD [Chthoniobacteraceae bacterium]